MGAAAQPGAAAVAASTAASTSETVHLAASAMTWPLAGFTTSKVAPSEAPTHWPLM